MIILLILGIVAGILAGIFGIGGGILFTPILFIVFGDAGIPDPVVLTIATSLFCTFVASAGSSYRQLRQNNFYFREGIKVGILGAVGVTLGKWVITSSYYNKEIFVLLFVVLLLYVAYMFYRRGRRDEVNSAGDTMVKRPITTGQAALTGGLGGFVAALAGIGGGGVMVPILNLGFKKSFKKTVSISSLAIVVISFAGWVQLALLSNGRAVQTLTSMHLGYVDFGAAFPLAVGGLAGGFAGAWLHLKVKQKHLQVSFALLAVGMAIKLIADTFS